MIIYQKKIGEHENGVPNGLIPNNDFKKILLCFLLTGETLNGLKKFATLLPKNWLAETPQALALMRLGRQSAERERISEINWNFYQRKKTAGKLAFHRVCLQSERYVD
ncbi:hypothetical protein [Peribacillus simplex]|uniref:hypothetical protein n=1 Tax=Peribacillus simplex TaxID=1478 RepID=UPI003D27313E